MSRWKLTAALGSGICREGRLSGSEAARLKVTLGEAVCAVRQGGLMAMRPLLLHASAAAREGRHRRVVHIEYAAIPLPFGLEWAV